MTEDQPGSREPVGFIGVGRMGGPMAERLLAAGHPVPAPQGQAGEGSVTAPLAVFLGVLGAAFLSGKLDYAPLTPGARYALLPPNCVPALPSPLVDHSRLTPSRSTMAVATQIEE